MHAVLMYELLAIWPAPVYGQESAPLRALIAAVAILAVALVAGPRLIAWLLRWGIADNTCYYSVTAVRSA